MSTHWRIRLKNQDGDVTQRAWDRGEAGIWYGAWTTEDFQKFNDHSRSNQQIADELNQLPDQQALVRSGAWESPLSGADIATPRRFYEMISENDWAVLYLQAGQAIALARMVGPVVSDTDHPLNTSAGEIFKYRKLIDKKTFLLSELPDAFRLLPAQGRGNVHEFDRMREHVKLLAEYATSLDVVEALTRMPFDKQLDLMGASAWESFCVSWLIMEKNFLPTGLSTGRTLKAIDIVGRNKLTGRRIIAQCKKDPYRVHIDSDFIGSVTPQDEVYYFAYGGADTPPPELRVRVIDGSYARQWVETENGKLFQRLFLANSVHDLDSTRRVAATSETDGLISYT